MRGIKQVTGDSVTPRPRFPIYEYAPDTHTKIDLEDVPEYYRDAMDMMGLSLVDPDRGRIIIHGAEECGKSFLIAQLLFNIDSYLSPVQGSKFFPLYVSLNVYNELSQYFKAFDDYIRFVCDHLGYEENDICIFTDSFDVAARIADSGITSKIVFESTDSMFSAMNKAAGSGMTAVWSSWDSINAEVIYLPRSELIDLVYMGQIERLEKIYDFKLKKKLILSVIEHCVDFCSIMTGENKDDSKDPFIHIPASYIALISRRVAQIASTRGVDVENLSKSAMAETIDQAARSFSSYIEKAHEINHMYSNDDDELDGAFPIMIDDFGNLSTDVEPPEALRGLISALGVKTQSDSQGESNKENSAPAEFTANKTLARRMRKNIIGQDDAIELVADSMAIPAAGLNAPEKPLRTFLFLGPTGVGKTELSKVLAKELYKDEMNIIRLDMSEFGTPGSATALFGSTPGYIGYKEEGGTLTREVAAHPNSLIILDEVEKAHPDTWDSMLQVFDAGRMTTGAGKVVDFSQTVIVMTSNLGSREMTARKLGFGGSSISQNSVHSNLKKIAMESLKKYFKPEFINRIDDIVVFKNLDADSARKIVLKEVSHVSEKLSNKGLELVKPKNDILDQILNMSEFDSYGAREVQRVIQKNVSSPLAKSILDSKKNKRFKLEKSDESGLQITVVK